MIGEHTDEYLEKAVESEYDYCISKHGNFKNWHEGFSVLDEETEEVQEAAMHFADSVEEAKYVLWKMIRKDDMEGADEHIKVINDIAEELAKECIQVMAMCRKWNDLIEKENA